MDWISPILLAYARNGWGERARESAFRKYRRRNAGDKRLAMTIFGFQMEVVVGEDSVDDDIAIKGVMEPATASILHGLFNECESFIDVGCNIGFYSCLFAQVNPQGRIEAIDPNPAMAERARRNLALGQAGDTRVQALGVGNRDEELTLHIAQRRHSLSSFAFVPTRAGGAGREVKVRVARLMDIVDPAKLRGDIFVKIDTEGFEYNVLAGVESEPAARFRYLCFEFSRENLAAAGVDAEKLFSVPWLADFDAYVIRGKQRVSPLRDDRGRLTVGDHDDILLVRRGVDLPNWITILPAKNRPKGVGKY